MASGNMNGPFGAWAAIYRAHGLEPRPLAYPGTDSKDGKPLGKKCLVRNWNRPDSEFPDGTLDEWVKQHPSYNIGLRMGTLLADGTKLGALDIDHDAYIKLGNAVLRMPISGRVGSKGMVQFVRYPSDLGKSLKIRVKGELGEKYGQVLELLFDGTLCVIPPSIHPQTRQPYRWLGKPLHEINLLTLPLMGE